MPKTARAAVEFINKPPRELSRNRNLTWLSTTAGNPHKGGFRHMIGHCCSEQEPKWGVFDDSES